jgi:hypothetical protein
VEKTIGTVVVAAFAASVAAALPGVAMTVTPAAKEIGHQIGHQVEATFRPPVFDRDGLTFNIAGFIQTLAKRGHSPIIGRSTGADQPDHRHARLLRTRSKRPRRRTAEQGDELTAFQLIAMHPLPLAGAVA